MRIPLKNLQKRFRKDHNNITFGKIHEWLKETFTKDRNQIENFSRKICGDINTLTSPDKTLLPIFIKPATHNFRITETFYMEQPTGKKIGIMKDFCNTNPNEKNPILARKHHR